MINNYFSSGNSMGVSTEQDLVEDIIIEAIQVYGIEFFYIPRTLIAKDEILGEDRLSQFNNAYPIEMYFESVEGFEGAGAFIDKFGYMLQQTATLVMARKRWRQLIGYKNNTVLPNRPAEGDLLYFPLTKSLFEITFVQDKNPFYQIGKLYTYKIQVELFKYSSEKMNTGIDAIDVFEDKKSQDVSVNINPDAPDSFGDNTKFDNKSSNIVFNPQNPFAE